MRRLAEEEMIAEQREAVSSTSSTNNLENLEDSDEGQILNAELGLPDVPWHKLISKRGRKNLYKNYT